MMVAVQGTKMKIGVAIWAMVGAAWLDPVDALVPEQGRRTFVREALAGAAMATVPPTAGATQPRNEALCGTGFFTNIYQYKCTEIGDIQEDGRSQPLSNAEEGATQSLMSKLGMEDVEIVDGGKAQSPENQKSKKAREVSVPKN